MRRYLAWLVAVATAPFVLVYAAMWQFGRTMNMDYGWSDIFDE